MREKAAIKQRGVQHDSSGAVMVEFTLATIFMIAFITICLHMLYLVYSQLTLQIVATETLRKSIIDVNESGHASETLSYAISRARSLGLFLSTSDVQICPVSNMTNRTCSSFNTGEPGEVVAVRLTYAHSTFIFGYMDITGFVIGRNEPV